MGDSVAPLPLTDTAPRPAPRGGRWAPLWHLLLFFLVLIVVRVGVDALSRALVVMIPTGSPLQASFAQGLTLAALFPGVLAMDVSYRALVHRFEARRPLEVEGPRIGRELGAGLGVGALLMSGLVAILALTGCYRVTGFEPWAPWLGLCVAIISGYGEELLARGVLQRLLGQLFGDGAGWVISSLVFGLAHAANPQATPLSVASIVCAGLLLGAAYLYTGRLWLAIGIHTAWNFTQGGIFGIPVSGHQEGGLLSGRLSCATVWSGGPFGVEGSVLCLVVCLAGAAVLVTAAQRRGHLRRSALKAASGAP